MAHSHKYCVENWTHYYDDKLDEKTHLEMTQHLVDCDQCLECYTDCVAKNISPAPSRVKRKVMRSIRKPSYAKEIMIAYATAACIATGIYSVGWLDKTIDYAPQGIEKSFNAINLISGNVNHITNKIIWRDFNEKEK